MHVQQKQQQHSVNFSSTRPASSPQFSFCSRAEYTVLTYQRYGDCQQVKTQKREAERQRKRHKRALIVARPLGFLPDSRPLQCEKHNSLSSIIKTAGLHALSHPYTHTHWGDSCSFFVSYHDSNNCYYSGHLLCQDLKMNICALTLSSPK